MIAVSFNLGHTPGRCAIAAALLAGSLLTGCQRSMLPDEDGSLAESFPAVALQEYLPGDAVAVFNLDVKRWREAASVRKGLQDALRQVLRKEEVGQSWLPLTGIDPFRDLDEARIILSSRAVFDPLVVFRGRFDSCRFQTGPGELSRRVVALDGGRFALYEYQDRRRGEVVTLAPAGEYLAVCDAQSSVLAALRNASVVGPTAPLDARLRDLLGKVDRRQQFWLAVSMEKLRPVPRLDSKALELILRPILQYADGIWGGLNLAEDVRAEFVFQARDEAAARNLEDLLRSSCDVAQGAHLLPGVDKALLPLFRLAGSGEVNRDGTAVRLTCRLAEE
jgi:hypothetical protein